MKVAIMGYGTIGSGVAEVLSTNAAEIKARVGEALDLKYILDLRDFPGDPNEKKFVKDYKKIADDKEIKIVVETMGGVEPAFTFVKAMLESGKSVTTSNKALVADKGAELIAIAKENNVNFMFEAAVGGGIPIIRTLLNCLTGDVIEEITGILNGTTNYMLTQMTEKGAEYADVLKDAQSKGYAEKDPTADVEGHDACRKIAILTSLIAGQQVDFEDIETEGISKITAADIKYAKKLGREIKLFATAKKSGESYVCRVAPYMVSASHPLFNVRGVFNSVFVKGNMLGDSMYYGSGAGKLPTASAVVGDMVAIARAKGNQPIIWEKKKLKLEESKYEMYRYFVRTKALESSIDSVFDDVEYVDIGIDRETGFVTQPMDFAEFTQRCFSLGPVISYIRLA